jgi:NADH:ubiquinone oxidoreductase subunit D
MHEMKQSIKIFEGMVMKVKKGPEFYQSILYGCM